MTISGQLPSSTKPTAEEFIVGFGEDKFPVSVEIENDLYIVEMRSNNKNVVVKTNYSVGEFIYRATMNDKYNVILQILEKNGTKLTIQYLGSEFELDVKTPRESELQKYMPKKAASDLSKFLMAPMPGSVVRVNVKPGDTVTANQALLVLEGMSSL